MKNRTIQLIFQTAYCTLGILGMIASVGFFEHTFYKNFYIQFTNLSNYFCIGLMFAELIQTIRKKDDSYVSTAPVLKFMGMLAILLTFLVFNLLLAGGPDRTAELNFQIASVLSHIVLPVLYVMDWFLFYEHGKVKWYIPFASALVPLLYAGVIYLRAWIYHFDTSTALLYPYFFLNLETQKITGVLMWIMILLVAFIVLGFVLFGIDKLMKKNKTYNHL